MTSSSDGKPQDKPTELSSPACLMHEADASYMGYLDAAELISLLNVLLEAERANASVARAIANEAKTGPLADLMHAIHADEERSCKMLNEHVAKLGGVASAKAGVSHGEATAIVDPAERIQFLVHRQSWIVQTLNETLPRVRDDRLRADLAAMLRTHEANIARANDVGVAWQSKV